MGGSTFSLVLWSFRSLSRPPPPPARLSIRKPSQQSRGRESILSRHLVDTDSAAYLSSLGAILVKEMGAEGGGEDDVVEDGYSVKCRLRRHSLRCHILPIPHTHAPETPGTKKNPDYSSLSRSKSEFYGTWSRTYSRGVCGNERPAERTNERTNH